MTTFTSARTAGTGARHSDTMRAVVQRTYGSSETLTLTEIDRPRPGPGQVLIEVRAAGIDRGVWHLMTGMPYLVRLAGFGLTRPRQPVLGLDVAGRVVEVGEGVDRFSVGDDVFGIGSGTYADYAVADAGTLARKPASMDFEQAAVAAISGITALQALTDVGRVRPGHRVLVIGASGGVGSYAVQIAAALGATVTGAASGTKAELVRALGAAHVVDYAREDYLDGRQRYDVIIDTGGLNPLRRLRRALTRDGTLVIVGGEGGNRVTGGIGRQFRAKLWSPFISQRLTFFISEERHHHVERLTDLIDTGSVTPAIGQRFSLDEVPAAIEALAAGRMRGKGVVVVRGAARGA